MEKNRDGLRRSTRLRTKPEVRTQSQPPATTQPAANQPAAKKAAARKAPAARKQQPKAKSASRKRKRGAAAAAAAAAAEEAGLSQSRSGQPAVQQNPQGTTTADLQQLADQLRAARGAKIHFWIDSNEWPSELFRGSGRIVVKTHPDSEEGEFTNTVEKLCKSYAYNNQQCVRWLNSKGSFLGEHRAGPTAACLALCNQLRHYDCDVPQNTLFNDEATFQYIQRRLRDRSNNTAIFQLIHRLLVPSAEIEIARGTVRFQHLIDSINEGWFTSVSLDEVPDGRPRNKEYDRDRLPMPQPDYSVGFSLDAFSASQMQKLRPFLGDPVDEVDSSPFKGAPDMLFPFLTAEVGWDAEAPGLVISERLNCHSMARAQRCVVELFTRIGRVKELHQEILGFSIVHDDRLIDIRAHYAIVEAGRVSFYRHPVSTVHFTAGDVNKWKAYKIVMAIYNLWVPAHFKRICSAVDDLPDNVDFENPTSTPPVFESPSSQLRRERDAAADAEIRDGTAGGGDGEASSAQEGSMDTAREKSSSPLTGEMATPGEGQNAAAAAAAAGGERTAKRRKHRP
ncbi:hypothetical protein BJX61DRAFT_543768 [Aspergillus egyptiacus]|nr:hypothetical protein BJX61DRAFT_543768 [Aspergillus egyptiacus]